MTPSQKVCVPCARVGHCVGGDRVSLELLAKQVATSVPWRHGVGGGGGYKNRFSACPLPLIQLAAGQQDSGMVRSSSILCAALWRQAASTLVLACFRTSCLCFRTSRVGRSWGGRIISRQALKYIMPLIVERRFVAKKPRPFQRCWRLVLEKTRTIPTTCIHTPTHTVALSSISLGYGSCPRAVFSVFHFSWMGVGGLGTMRFGVPEKRTGLVYLLGSDFRSFRPLPEGSRRIATIGFDHVKHLAFILGTTILVPRLFFTHSANVVEKEGG